MYPDSFFSYIASKLNMSVNKVRSEHTMYQLEILYDNFRSEESLMFQRLAYVIRARNIPSAAEFADFAENI